MKYMDYTAYKKLKLQIQDIKWVIYLPTKQGATETSGNSSLLHNAISLFKKTLRLDHITDRQSQTIISNLRKMQKELLVPLKGSSVMLVIFRKGNSDIYELPIKIESGYISDLQNIYFLPLDEFYNKDKSYYFLDLHQNGSKIFKLNRDGFKQIGDPDIQKSLSTVLMLDEAVLNNIQTRFLTGMNNGISEGIHGQGGFKDKHKGYIKEYLRYIDKKLSKYNNQTLNPVILMGSRQLAASFTKLSHNKRFIKGYLKNTPNNFTIEQLESY